ncbi:MAG: hypothetical protein R6V58_11690 [Planctomycetota bacterium]
MKSKRQEWLACFEGEDRHAITNQLYWMIWDTAVYRVINDARKYAPRDDQGRVELNGMMHRLINKGFFQTQALAIRRLVDTYSLKGEKGVFSLRGLVRDIEPNRHLLTRWNILNAEGHEYHYEKVRAAWQREFEKDVGNDGRTGVYVPEDRQWHLAEMRHKHMDALADVQPDQRKRSDRPRKEVFDTLKSMLDSCSGEVKQYCDKFIAHAATPGSRTEAYRDDEASLTLKHLYQAHEHLCRVANFVSVYLLGGGCQGFLPAPQYDQFAYIDRPLADEATVEKLRQAWTDYHEEVETWRCISDVLEGVEQGPSPADPADDRV